MAALQEFVSYSGAAAAFGVANWVAIAVAQSAEAENHQTTESERANLFGLIESRESRAHAVLAREIVGPLPFRPIPVDDRWRTSTVIDLASAIYTEKAFDRMPILADALMDAGCDSDDILNHCRQSDDHALGCWVLDLLLDKK